MITDKTREQWWIQDRLIRRLQELQPSAWFNPNIAKVASALSDVGLTQVDVDAAEARLKRFAAFIAQVFPETACSDGLIESPIQAVPTLYQALSQYYQIEQIGELWLKLDSHLPISGSIKARGGIYEVLKHAETLAINAGLLSEQDDYAKLATPSFKAFFNCYKIAVGSTGNLGLSIGIMGATLGFQVTVHMSSDARQWKKDKLRVHGVQVIEYASDYSQAVAEGRRQAEQDPCCYFIDDENSTNLFLGYAVAALRLKQQFAVQNIPVDAQHPLFVYLPCGVGGGPGGVAFGLKLVFGDHVHCIFAEPTHSPSMLLGVYTGLHDKISVQDIGIDNITAADGLAVGRPSGFVGKAMQRLIDGYFTMQDESLYAMLALLDQTEDIQLEPSAVAGMLGINHVLSIEQQDYRDKLGLSSQLLKNAHHLVWATGGSMVPFAEMQNYLAKGRKILK
ncbi:D-serine ammonia-lyase [Acinetobacter qingfengensis]|uniref:Probable D-serine dehydratase n=1 Tax=Acinetobacter qingfengensis TaxID=1262585 RepID=A0A1E7QWQ1_9GAMM|nr:D-serine ammonia-lyase [Acinetobacter qingfengensis]